MKSRSQRDRYDADLAKMRVTSRGRKNTQREKSLPTPPPTCTRRAVWFPNPLPSSLNWRILCQEWVRTNTNDFHPAAPLTLLQTPGPAALPKIELDVFKTRAPGYTMGTRTQLQDKTVKPGPADYRTGRPALTKQRHREMQSDCPEKALGSGARAGQQAPRQAMTSAHGHHFLLYSCQVELIKPQAPAATFGLRHSVYTTPLILDV
ncbi:hypothetical protein Q9233_016309 [Columba guinea]|nr:hypothetical protein Q9233_016309 [Columba guinea]